MRLSTLIFIGFGCVLMAIIGTSSLAYLRGNELIGMINLAEETRALEKQSRERNEKVLKFKRLTDAELKSEIFDSIHFTRDELVYLQRKGLPSDSVRSWNAALNDYRRAFNFYLQSEDIKNASLANLSAAAESLNKAIWAQTQNITREDIAARGRASKLEEKQMKVLEAASIFTDILIGISHMLQAANEYTETLRPGLAQTVRTDVQELKRLVAAFEEIDPEMSLTESFQSMKSWLPTFSTAFEDMHGGRDGALPPHFAKMLEGSNVPILEYANQVQQDIDTRTQRLISDAIDERNTSAANWQRTAAINTLRVALRRAQDVSNLAQTADSESMKALDKIMTQAMRPINLQLTFLGARFARDIFAASNFSVRDLRQAWKDAVIASDNQALQSQRMVEASQTEQAVASGIAKAAADKVLSAAEGVRNFLIGVVVVGFFCAVGLTTIIQRRLTWPLAQLISAIRRLNAGELSTPVPRVKSGKELTELAAAAEVLRKTSIERARLADELEYRAFTDELTGLPNRAALQIAVNEQLQSPSIKELSFAFIDVNKFKNINDYYGHQIGDQLLVEIANRISGAVRIKDKLGRISGDEFVLVMEAFKSKDEMMELLNDIEMKLAEPYTFGSFTFHSSVSIGVSCYPEDGSDYETLRAAADSAMYRAKASPRERLVFYDHTMASELTVRMELEGKLRCAIKSKSFVPVFQPKVCLKDGRVLGFEALVRWVDETGRLRSPGEFIDTAAELGLLDDIMKILSGKIVEEAKKLDAKFGTDTTYSINISPEQARNRDTVNMILYDMIIPELKDRVVVELTEETVVDAEQIQDVFGPLVEEAGIKLSIDDFGTGYSSLSSFASISAHELKIDRSFIDNVDQEEIKQRILSTIVNFAMSAGLSTVAEGVERREELDFLIKHTNVDTIQGYLFCAPMAADALIEKAGDLHLPATRAKSRPRPHAVEKNVA